MDYITPTTQQNSALESILDGDQNVVLTGSPGTGKSVLIKLIEEKLTERGIKVQLTASTGIAAYNIGGKTIQKLLRLGIGHASAEYYATQICMETHHRDRLRYETDVIILDECSMISADILDKINHILKAAMANSQPFGSIRVILVGDFLQLPPIASDYDSGKYLFESKSFQDGNFDIIRLTEVLRQVDPIFKKCIAEIAVGGELSQSTVQLLENARKDPDDDAVHLCALNTEVDYVNSQKLCRTKGLLKTYKSQDKGSQKVLSRITAAEKVLRLKVGVPIIITMNSDTYCNGTRGIVRQLQDEFILVETSSSSPWITVRRQQFVRSTVSTEAVRNQFPMKLAFAMTIHRAQGLTLPKIHINCEGMFERGQLAVAISRSRSVECVSVEGLVLESIQPCSRKVLEFMTGKFIPEQESDTTSSDSGEEANADYPAFTELPGFEKIQAYHLEEQHEHHISQLHEIPAAFATFMWKLMIIINDPDEKIFLQRINLIPYLPAYKKACGLFGNLPSNARRIAINAYHKFRDNTSNTHSEVEPEPYTNTERGRYRYILGSIVYRMIGILQTKQIQSDHYDEAVEIKLKLVKLLKVQKVDLMRETDDPTSLFDTEIREQYQLTYVTDEAASFYYQLNLKLDDVFIRRNITRQTPQRAYDHGMALEEQFCNLYNSGYRERAREVYLTLLRLTVIMRSREARRVAVDKIKKTKALRTEIIRTTNQQNIVVAPEVVEAEDALNED